MSSDSNLAAGRAKMNAAKPADIIDGDLTYVWRTNISRDSVTVAGNTVTYTLSANSRGPTVLKDARVGPPSKLWPDGVGIYVRKP